MRAWPLVVMASVLLCGCGSDPDAGIDTNEGSEGDTAESAGDASEIGDEADTSGDGDGDGNGDGDGDLPVPQDLPTPTGPCPDFVSGDATFAPATLPPRQIKLWVGDDPQPGGMLLIYWHAYTSVPDEAAYTLSMPVIEAIVAAGGVVAAPYPAEDVGEYPWFSVGGSDRPDDMMVADELVACALQEVGVDPRRIHATGMSAGGIQTTAFSMARSRYIASVASFSGGLFSELPFEDPNNRFAAMIIHGGDGDLFGGIVNFKMLSTLWFNQLIDNGNFAFMCDHGGGHTVPQGYGDNVANFFFAHPFGTEPSPYLDGLPGEFPTECSL